MSNLFVNIPAPAADGVGAPVSVANLGPAKTIVVEGTGGSTGPFVLIEVSNDPAALEFAPLYQFQKPGEQLVTVACLWMRARVTNYQGSGAPNVSVGADDAGVTPATLVATAGNGKGAGVDVSSMGPVKTVQVSGDFRGACNIEVSTNEGLTYSQADELSFQTPGKVITVTSMIVTHMRVSRSGIPQGAPPGLPVINVAGTFAGAVWPPYPAVLESHTIFANQTGDNETGNGTSANPYLTFQRAIRDVPHIIPPNHEYTVDISNLGVEILPAGYQMPEIHTPTPFIRADNTLFLPFRFKTALNIRATPVPAAGFTVGDMTIMAADIAGPIVVDPSTLLTTINLAIARPAWGVDLLKGKILVSNYTTLMTSIVHSNTATSISLTNTTTTLPVGAQSLVISDPGATLQTSLAAGQAFGLVQHDISGGIAWQGVKFTLPVGGSGTISLNVLNAGQPALEMCDADGLFFGNCPNSINLHAIVVRNKLFGAQASSLQLNRGMLLSVAQIQLSGNTTTTFQRAVLDGTLAPIQPGPTGGASGTPFFRSGEAWDFLNCLIRGSAGAEVIASGAVACRAGGSWNFNNTRIVGSAGHAILAEGPVQVTMANTTGDGTNVGVGLRLNDGASVRVRDDLTLVTGALGDMRVGALPVRTWVDFRTALPGPAPSGRGIKNELDLNQAITGTGTMLTFAAGVVTLTNAAPTFTPSMVGQLLALPSAPTPANAGVFAVAIFVDASNITFANPDGVTEPFAGTWKVLSTYPQGEEVTGASSGGRSQSRVYQRPL